MESTPAKIARFVLGLALVIFGANKFGHFIPVPPHTEAADALLGAMVQSGYLMDMVGAVEVICGAALVSGFFVPLSLVILAPISINIVVFHLVLDPGGVVPALLIGGLNLFLGITHLRSYQDILMPR
ncbi:MAG: putative oxidoreductase [Hyphomicrobiaceae bacterium]|jgi:putative oxidoreductase